VFLNDPFLELLRLMGCKWLNWTTKGEDEMDMIGLFLLIFGIGVQKETWD
jgi:hypothetical protein